MLSRVLCRLKPGGDDHSSTLCVATELLRLPEISGTGHPGDPLRESRSLFTLHQVGFTWTSDVTAAPVSSYLTFSPLPALARRPPRQAVYFCGTFPGVAPGRRYRPPFPLMPGLSSRCSRIRKQPAIISFRAQQRPLISFELKGFNHSNIFSATKLPGLSAP